MGEVKVSDAEIIDGGEMVDLDVLPLEEDTKTPITDNAKKNIEKEEKIKAEETEIDPDDLKEEDTEEKPEQEQEQEETPEDTPDKEPEEEPENKAQQIEIEKQIKTVQQEIRQAHSTVELINESNLVEPKRPADPEDEEAMAQYRVDLAVYRGTMAQAQAQAKVAKKKVETLARRQESLFVQRHDGEDLEPFKQWISESIELQSAFFTGSRDLETLYKWYRAENPITDKEHKEVKELSKKGIKFKAVSTKGKKGGEDLPTGGNGFDSKYKFANLPMFKDFVKLYKGKRSEFTGKTYSAKEINELCEQEYKMSKGLPLI